MNQDNTPFYLAINNGLKADSVARKSWFKSGAVGINKFNDNGAESRNRKRQASKSQQQKDNDPDAKRK
ncbi:hypothetical protein pdam_00025168 [Pocillopora damicornis]|uniref:Uncharacterized protein n=1 Tax=Pocillopora damicornis TaxID=46731 RepID=A0A3M6V6J7_POCDA|nr:hypothetical protein pdam_00025168 [Pocillopora damicornis]